MNRVVILAAGRGTRMQRPAAGARLDAEQRRMAERGFKALIPFGGRPYLDYVISAAADAGLREVCLIVAPGANPIREHYERLPTRRVQIRFAVQAKPRGSAHALLAAEPLVADEPFLVINSDNFYPAPVLTAVRSIGGSGMAGFTREALVEGGNIPPERVAAYALVTADTDGCLADIVEKPDAATLHRLRDRSWISMTCWHFERSIFEACRSIGPSVRGEWELPEAVAYAARVLGVRFRIVPVAEAVLDLSGQQDVASVAERLAGREVAL
jgi:dTDP-glucose pyrophosphorylase